MEMDKELEIIGGELPAIVESGGLMLTDDYIEKAGRQFELRSRLLMTALKAIKPHDFQDFDGKPYLEGEGGARIMAVVRGFKVGEAKFVIEQIAPHYFVECQIPMEFMGATTVTIGDCSTADSFFTGKEGNAGRYKKYQDQTGSETMAARLLLGDAKKKARENAISRGVCELLGIKGLSWDDLAQLGFTRGQAGSSVKFKAGSQGGEIKTLTVSEALKVGKGSVISIIGKAENAKVKQVKKSDGNISPVTDYIITDDKNKIKVSAWGECIDDLKAGDTILASGVKITEYNGNLQYTAKEISVKNEEVPDESGSNTD